MIDRKNIDVRYRKRSSEKNVARIVLLIIWRIILKNGHSSVLSSLQSKGTFFHWEDSRSR